MSKLTTFAVLTLALMAPFSSSQADNSLDEYIEIFTNGNSQQQTQASKDLAWAGLSDPALFDPIEKLFLEKYLVVENKYAVDDTAWLAKALSYSGNVKYLPTLEKGASDSPQKKIKKHSAKSIPRLEKYTRWNPVISDKSNSNASKSDEINRYANMLRSDDLELKRIGAKRVYNTHAYDTYLLDILDTEILENYGEASKDDLFIDSVAWMCKALSGSRVVAYKPTIVEVSENAGSSKVAKYATKYLKYFE